MFLTYSIRHIYDFRAVLLQPNSFILATATRSVSTGNYLAMQRSANQCSKNFKCHSYGRKTDHFYKSGLFSEW